MGAVRLAVNGKWESVLNKDAKAKLEAVLPDFLRAQRWFGGKARRLRSAQIQDAVPIPHGSKVSYMTLVEVQYEDGKPDTYALPLAYVTGPEGSGIEAENSQSVVARLAAREGEGVLVTPMRDPSFCHALLAAIGGEKCFKSGSGTEIRGVPTSVFARLAGKDSNRLEPSLMRAEQSNSSILFGDRLVLKVFRRLDEGVNPDLEVGAFLTETGFAHIPAVGGALEYRRSEGEPITLGILHGFIRSEGDAWSFTLRELSGYYERAAHSNGERPEVFPDKSLWNLVGNEPPPEARGLIGPYLDSAGLLGRRTAELHLALASDLENPVFAPEPFSPAIQRALYESMRDLAARTFQLLEERLPALPESLQTDARRVQALEPQVLDRFRSVLERKITAMRTRVHGDYHLGQVLYTGSDFIIIDFEGEPARPISERRTKRSPLQDVAGMLRSFHYAAYGALMDRMDRAAARAEDFTALEPWAGRWYTTVASVYVTNYLDAAGHAPFLPKGREELVSLLDAYQLDKAIYEMAYELNNRPDWLRIPIKGILSMLADSQ